MTLTVVIVDDHDAFRAMACRMTEEAAARRFIAKAELSGASLADLVAGRT